MTRAQKVVYRIGCVTVFVLAVVALMFGFDVIDQHLHHQSLRHGYVVSKNHDDGSYWYSSWEIGDYSITKRHGGEPYYYIEVVDGEKVDYWKVSQERWEELEIGDYIGR